MVIDCMLIKFEDMLKDGVKWITGTCVIMFYTWCYLIIICCSNNNNNVMFAYGLSSSSSYANVSTSWSSSRGTLLQSQGNNAPFSFGFGFFPSTYGYVVATYIGPSINESESSDYEEDTANPVVVWCANRNHEVRSNATLDFTSQGDLVLKDANGSFVWSSNTSNHSAKSMQLKPDGNLVLSDARGEPIWESFHYPTNTLLYSQNFSEGQRLVSSYSSVQYYVGIYYASLEFDGIHAFVNSIPPQEYAMLKYGHKEVRALRDLYSPVEWRYFAEEYGCSQKYTNFSSETSEANYYMRLDERGHLKLYCWNQSEIYVTDIFGGKGAIIGLGDCGYPGTCGRYGICKNNMEDFTRQCRCPPADDGGLDYFKPKKEYNPASGCTLWTPLSCPDTHKLHTFLKVENVTYFDYTPTFRETDVEKCKSACLHNCSCKAVFFRYHNDASSGNCTLHSEIFTMTDISDSEEVSNYKAVAFIKVHAKKRNLVVPVSASLIAAFVLVTGACFYMFILWRRRRAKSIDCSLAGFMDTVTRFSFESLVAATQDFQTRLGRGGFGSVFEGALVDGTKVAVKRLDSLGQGRKEFLAEVNTIGSIHHFNLVKLIGFCDDGLNRLLVYEYMCNGSLEKWIFNQDVARTLSWKLRRRVIDGVAIGLEYLHEHCNQNIIHFDIKAQNILLDKDFNVKISDFGLAKLVDRDHSQVVTMVRGTPGYMAPELITGRNISCKADVYSFGILVLEIVCGRRNFGSSESECLTNLVKLKADGDQLSELIDERGEDMMQQHKEEVVNMMKIAIWCLQPHFIRPTMSMVVKVLQDLANMESLTDLSHLNMVHEAALSVEANFEFSVRPTESLLSGPR